MKKLLTLLCLFSSLYVQGQMYYYHSSSDISTYHYDYNISQGINFIGRIYEDKKTKERLAEEKAKAQKKVQEIRDYYGTLGKYPETVADGWHDVVMLSGDEFITYIKVQVKNNKISLFVWDDWIEQEVSFSGPIINGKTGAKLKNGRGALEGMAEVYFINYIADNTVMASAPLKPGKVTFWTNNKKFDEVFVLFEDAKLGAFKHKYAYTTPPECGSEAEINVIYKPGTYSYKAYEKGSYSWNTKEYGIGKVICEGNVKITENGCQLIQLNYPKEMNKK